MSETVKIVNPNNPDDFIVIAAADYEKGQPHAGLGITAMEKWDDRKAATPEPPRPDGQPPQELPQAARIGELKTMTVADLGPALEGEDDPEMLVRLLDLESRTTARTLIEDRLEALKTGDGEGHQ